MATCSGSLKGDHWWLAEVIDSRVRVAISVKGSCVYTASQGRSWVIRAMQCG